MFLEIGILATLYFGAKKSRAAKSRDISDEPAPDEVMDTQDSEHSPEGSSEEVKTSEAIVAEALPFRKKSLYSMVLFALSPLNPVFTITGLAVYSVAIAPIFIMAKNSVVKDRKIDVQALFFTADILRIMSGYYFTAAFGLWMNYAIIIYREKIKSDYRKITIDIFKNLPPKVWMVIDEVEVEIPLEEVKSGNIISVKAGGVIPVDGIIRKGFASISEHILTGESKPAEKGEGDTVFANTLIISGQIQVEVVNSGEDSVAAKIASVITSSSDYKSNVEIKGDQWAARGTLPTFIAAMVVLPFLGKVIAASVIYSHIGLRIRFLAPLGTFRHITEASQKGILVKDGRTFENLHEIDTVLFDKTGTLTTNLPKVSEIHTVNGYDKNEILRLAATAERTQSHPIAEAILNAAEKAGIELLEIDDSKYKVGYGVSVKVNNQWIRVGSDRFMESEGLLINGNIPEVQTRADAAGHSMVLIGIDNEVCGAIELEAQIRDEVRDIIRQLRQKGIGHMAIVSGDQQRPTESLARELELDDFYAQVLPEQKASIVETLQSKGKKVCFIGDGINDAIALKKAAASISISGATTLAIDIAEIVLLDGSLSALPDVFEISEELNKDLNRRYELTVAAGMITLPGAIFLGFGFTTILLVQSAFFVVATGNPVNYLKDMIALERKTIAEFNDTKTKEASPDTRPDTDHLPVNGHQQSSTPVTPQGSAFEPA